MKKTKKLLLYLTDDQHRIIKLRATRMGMSMCNYILDAIADKFEKDTNLGWPEEIKDYAKGE